MSTTITPTTRRALGSREQLLASGTGAVPLRPRHEIREGSRYSKSLVIGLEILESLSAANPVRGIAELAGALELSRSTTHRYASTLVMLGLLEQDRSRRYRLSPRAADFGLALLGSIAVRAQADEHLRDLREQLGHTVSLAVLDGAEVLYLERLYGHRRGQHEIDRGLGVASRLPAYRTAIGKVLLAHLSESDYEALLGALELAGDGAEIRRRRRALHAELGRVRAAGLAVDEQEQLAGVRTLAAPVIDADGNVLAAIDVAVPIGLFSAETMLEAFGRRVAAAAAQIALTIQAAPGQTL